MTLEQGLVAHLLADSPVAAIVSNRIHPSAVPQGGATPAIVYNRISSLRDVDMDGPMDFIQVRLRIDCWSTSYGGAKDLASAVRVALNGVGLASPKLLGAVPVQLVHLENDSDVSVFEGDQMDYRVSQDWNVIFLET